MNEATEQSVHPTDLEREDRSSKALQMNSQTHKMRDHHKTSNTIQSLFALLTKFLLSFQPQTAVMILPHFELTFLPQSTANQPNLTPALSSLTFLVAFLLSAANSSSSPKLQVSCFPVHCHGHYRSFLCRLRLLLDEDNIK